MPSSKVKRLLREFDLIKDAPVKFRPELTKTQLMAIERDARRAVKKQKKEQIEQRKLERSIYNLTGEIKEPNYKNDYSNIQNPVLKPLRPVSRFVKRLMIKRHL